MLGYVLVACLLSVVSCKFCCTPEEWEGDMGIVIGSVSNGKAYLTEGSMEISYDARNRMISTKQSLVVDGNPITQLYIEDFNAGLSYRISDVDGSCTKSSLNQWVPNCIPDNATESTFRYGLGADSVDAKSYMVSYQNFDVYYAVTADTCVPMAEDVVGVFNGVSVTEAITFANISPGIVDRSVFNIPSSCNDAQMFPLPGIGAKRSSPFR